MGDGVIKASNLDGKSHLGCEGGGKKWLWVCGQWSIVNIRYSIQ